MKSRTLTMLINGHFSLYVLDLYPNLYDLTRLLNIEDVLVCDNVLDDKVDDVVDIDDAYLVFVALVDSFLLGFLEDEIFFLVVDEEALDD